MYTDPFEDKVNVLQETRLGQMTDDYVGDVQRLVPKAGLGCLAAIAEPLISESDVDTGYTACASSGAALGVAMALAQCIESVAYSVTKNICEANVNYCGHDCGSCPVIAVIRSTIQKDVGANEDQKNESSFICRLGRELQKVGGHVASNTDT